MQKDELRKHYAEKRARAHARLRYDDKQKIFSHLREIPSFSKAKTIMCYFARGSEVPTKNLVLELLNSAKRVVLPRTNTDDMLIIPYYIDSIDDVELASFGLLEPKLSCKICKTEDIDVILVPGVAFDQHGHRLGYGLGFYDKFLPGAKCETIGLAYDDTICENCLPCDSHDIPVDNVVSERRVLKIKKK